MPSILLVGPPARADELPEGACAARISFDAIDQALKDIIQPELDGYAESVRTQTYHLYLTYLGADFSVGSSVGTSGQNDPNSSNDDVIHVDIRIHVRVHWEPTSGGVFGMQKIIHYYVDLMFPQDRPTEVDPQTGYNCRWGSYLHEFSRLVHVLASCPDNTDEQSCPGTFIWMHNYMLATDGFWDASWYYDPDHPERRVLVDAAAEEAPLTPEQYGPFGCVRTYFDYCDLLDPDKVSGVANITTPNALCQVCEVAGHWIPHEVTVPASAFPGVWVVGARVGDDLWDSPGLRFQSKLERGLRELGWLDASDSGQTYSAACHLQQEIAARLDPSLNGRLPVGCDPDDPGLCVPFRQLISESGGVRISGTQRAIDLLVPPLQPRPEDSATPAGCSPRPYYSGLRDTAALLSYALDFPKVANMTLLADDNARLFGIHIACNQGMNCAADNDDDEDGWCNDVDLCPGVVTGANCDSDDGIGLGDGVGDGDPTLWDYCLVVNQRFPEASRLTKEYRRLRQFYCGGCDNCQGVSNPDVYPALPDPSWFQVRYPDEPADNSNTVTLPTRQLDFDRDWLGDACDPDIDGDGIRNELDCDDRNGCLGLDLDQDTVCDSYGSHSIGGWSGPCDRYTCTVECYYWWGLLGDWYDREGCLDRCVGDMDNCAPADPATDPYCADVFFYCMNPNGTSPCDPKDVARCAMRYGNATQEDTFGLEQVGDKCEEGIGSLSLTQDYSGGRGAGHGLPLGINWEQWGDTYTVRMRLWGGDVPIGGNGAPYYHSVDHTAVEVGACACTPGDHNGWEFDCSLRVCPRRGEWNQQGEVAWNPIHAPEIAAQHQDAQGDWRDDFEVHCGPGPLAICDAPQLSADDHDLVYARRMPFSLDESANSFAFTWDWWRARQFPEYTTARSFDYDKTGWTTALRAAWPDWVSEREQAFYDDLYDHLVTFTAPIPVQITTGDYSAYAYFGPAFITKIVDYWPDGAAELAKGWMLAADPVENRTFLYRLGPGAVQIESSQRLAPPVGVDLQASPIAANIALAPLDMLGGQLSEAAMALPASDTATSTAVVLALYQEAGDVTGGGAGSGDSQGTPARLLVGQVGTGEQVTLMDTAALTGLPAPALEEAHVVILPQRQQVLLVGRDPAGAAAPVAYRLRLPEGAWTGPHSLSALGAREGFALAYDALGEQLLLFGGRLGGSLSTAGAYTADLFSIDPGSLAVRRISTAAPESAARWRAGLFLNAADRRLFVVGGARSGAHLADGFVIDLRSGTFTGLDLAAGPGAMLEPYVCYDRQASALWVGDLEGSSTAEGLDLWRLGKNGAWLAVPTFVGPERPVFPYSGSFLPGRLSDIWLDASASAALPGQVMLATIEASKGSLEATIETSAGDPLGTSEPAGEGLEQAGFLCPAQGTCRIALALRTTDRWSGGAIPFTLNVREASLRHEDDLVLPVPTLDMILYRGALVTAGPLGLGVLDPATLEWLSFALEPSLTAAQAVTPCGANLCLAHLGAEGLQVLDLSNLVAPRLKGNAATLGPAWDVASTGRRVFAAHGVLGVGVYDLDGQGLPTHRQTLSIGGILRSVAARRGVLAAARQAGVVKLFRLGETIQPAGSIQGLGQIERVRFVGGSLWILSKRNKHTEQVDVYRVNDPDAPAHLGSFSHDAAKAFRSLWLGTRMYSTGGLGHLLEVERVEAQ